VAFEGRRSVDAGAAMLLSVGSMYCWAFCTKFEMLNMASGRPESKRGSQLCRIQSLLAPHCATRAALVDWRRETGALCRARAGGAGVSHCTATESAAKRLKCGAD